MAPKPSTEPSNPVTLQEVRESLTSEEAIAAMVQILSERGWGLLSTSDEPAPDVAALRDRLFADMRAANRAALDTLVKEPVEADWECCNCGKTGRPRSLYWHDFQNADEGHMCPECCEWTETQKAALMLISGGMEWMAGFLIEKSAGPTVVANDLRGAFEAVGLELPDHLSEKEQQIVDLFQEASDWAVNRDLSAAAFKASEAIDQIEKLASQPKHPEGDHSDQGGAGERQS